MADIIRVSTNGSGAGTGDTDTGASGSLHGVGITLTGTHTATAVTITEVGGLGRTLLAVTGLSANAAYNPQNTVQGSDGVEIADVMAPFVFTGVKFHVAVTGGPNNVTNAVTVKLNIMERI